MDKKAENEINHGQFLAAGDTEMLWGWGTPAGRKRAERRAQLISIGARLGPGVLALEIGCGTGMFTEMFAQTGARIIAVDISAELIAKAIARQLPPDRVHFMVKRFEDCDVDGPFDAVIGSSVLHHLDCEKALSKIHALLKPGGVMSFAEPNMLNPQVFIERKFRKFFPYVSPDETAFLRWRLKRMLEKAGFTDIEITPFDWLHPATPRPLLGLVAKMANALERIPCVREFSGSLYLKAIRP